MRLVKKEIWNWEVKFEFEEVAASSQCGGTQVGAGSYKFKLNRLIPHIMPMHGLKIKCTYNGAKNNVRDTLDTITLARLKKGQAKQKIVVRRRPLSNTLLCLKRTTRGSRVYD